MNRSNISYLVISDIHLGHPRTKTSFIINNLLTFFKKNNTRLKKLDIIFIAGDLFDKLLVPNSSEYVSITNWLSLLALYCRNNNIRLRVLEGTSSHDWHQARSFSTIIKTLELDIDYKYIETLSIEHIEDLGIHILYLPDNLNLDASDTLTETHNLLKKYELTKVDIGIFHGAFNFQLPMVELTSTHDAEQYLNLVTYYINIGHIHKSMVYDRILGQGSFDRLAHGEEESKGAMLMRIHHNKQMDYMFLKNDDAMAYITINLQNIETLDIPEYLDKQLNKVKLGSHVRLIVCDDNMAITVKPIQNRYNDIVFTILKKNLDTPLDSKPIRKIPQPFEINSKNLPKLLLEQLSKHELTDTSIKIVNSELSMAMNNIH